jgi:hypothetical protein
MDIKVKISSLLELTLLTVRIIFCILGVSL